MKLPEDLRRPSGGETIDGAAQDAVRLAHQALDRFPGLVRRHKFLAGGAAISSALVALAGVAVARRMHRGQTPQDAVATVTEQELEGLRAVPSAEEEEDGEAVDETPDDAEAVTAEADDDVTAENRPALNGDTAPDVVLDGPDGEPSETSRPA